MEIIELRKSTWIMVIDRALNALNMERIESIGNDRKHYNS